MNVIETSKDGYPELEEKRDFILNVIRAEEEKFEKTYQQGMDILEEMEAALTAKGEKQLSGEDAFRLYDTYGFPLDNTKEILGEKGFSVDEEGFRTAMDKQRTAAREDRRRSGDSATYMGAAATVYEKLDPSMNSEFIGYDTLTADSRITAMVLFGDPDQDEEDEVVSALSDGQKGAIITEKTPFYGTMGGQVGDKGIIVMKSAEDIDAAASLGKGAATFEVTSTEHVAGGKIAHIGRVTSGMFSIGADVTLAVDEKNRMATCRNHSATHLLQKALRDVLGTHVEQAGSYQDADRTRFDFSHFQAMTKEELRRVEDIVNEKIAEGLPVRTEIMSLELQIGQFKILSESGVAAGVRRIEALTGDNVRHYYERMEAEMNEAAALVRATPATLSEHIRALQKELKSVLSENEAIKAKEAKASLGSVMDKVTDVKGVPFVAAHIGGIDANELRTLGDDLKAKTGGVILLISDKDGKVSMVAMASDEAVKRGAHAGNLIKSIAAAVGGGGGGRPNMAQAGGKNPGGIEKALQQAKTVLDEQIK